jgi:hypothetical protein
MYQGSRILEIHIDIVMPKNERSVLRERAMLMSVEKPTLVQNVRTLAFMEYRSLTSPDITKCDREIEEFKRTGKIACPTSYGYFKFLVALWESRRVLSCDVRFLPGE